MKRLRLIFARGWGLIAWLAAPEKLERDEGGAPGPGRAGLLRWLWSSETLGRDDDSNRQEVTGPGLVSWLLSREDLGPQEGTGARKTGSQQK